MHVCLYHVGNTSSRKITEVKQLRPRLALGWVTIQVDAAVKNTILNGETGFPI